MLAVNSLIYTWCGGTYFIIYKGLHIQQGIKNTSRQSMEKNHLEEV